MQLNTYKNMEFNISEYTEYYHELLGKDRYEKILRWTYIKLGYPQSEVVFYINDIDKIFNGDDLEFIMKISTDTHKDYYIFIYKDEVKMYKTIF